MRGLFYFLCWALDNPKLSVRTIGWAGFILILSFALSLEFILLARLPVVGVSIIVLLAGFFVWDWWNSDEITQARFERAWRKANGGKR